MSLTLLACQPLYCCVVLSCPHCVILSICLCHPLTSHHVIIFILSCHFGSSCHPLYYCLIIISMPCSSPNILVTLITLCHSCCCLLVRFLLSSCYTVLAVVVMQGSVYCSIVLIVVMLCGSHYHLVALFLLLSWCRFLSVVALFLLSYVVLTNILLHCSCCHLVILPVFMFLSFFLLSYFIIFHNFSLCPFFVISLCSPCHMNVSPPAPSCCVIFSVMYLFVFSVLCHFVWCCPHALWLHAPPSSPHRLLLLSTLSSPLKLPSHHESVNSRTWI